MLVDMESHSREVVADDLDYLARLVGSHPCIPWLLNWTGMMLEGR